MDLLFQAIIAEPICGSDDHTVGLCGAEFYPISGFKQIAVFSMVGLSAAWVTSILFCHVCLR
jgi:hypothetical protein